MNDMSRAEAPGPIVDAPEADCTDPTDPIDPMAEMRRLLLEQAYSLNGMFHDFTNYSVEVFAESPGPAQAYIRLALRAQSNCRASLQAMAKADEAQRRALDAPVSGE